ncbi:MAG: transposase [Candidatus Binatia bacterium]
MSRPLRIQYEGAVYHVMNRGTARQPSFLRGQDYQAFLDTLADAHRIWGIEVFGYCVMRNHYHVCLRTPKGNLARVMRHVDGLYTQRFNRSHNRDGALFRGRYKAILVDRDEYLSAVVRYIHLNPVEAGIIKRPEDYRWSSHRQYLRPGGGPKWLSTAEVLEQLGGRQAFHDFVLSGNEESLKEFYESGRQSVVLGGDEFVEEVRGRVGELGREQPRYQRRIVQRAPEHVLRRVAAIYKIAKEDVLRGVRGKENEARKVAMYLVRRCCDQTLQETAKLFGLGSYGAVGWSCHGIKAKMQSDKKFRAQIESLGDEIYQQKI